jgi:TolB-like protein
LDEDTKYQQFWFEGVHIMKKIIMPGLLGVLFMISVVQAAPKTVAVLPMKMNAAKDNSFLQNGIVDMLSSRLAWKDTLDVVRNSKTLEAAKAYGDAVDEQRALKIGKNLHADYVVFGSLTILGQSVSIDAKILDVANDQVLDSVFTQAPNMDEVIPKIDNFAQSIKSKILGPQTAAAAATPMQAATPSPASDKTRERPGSRMLAPAYIQNPAEKIRVSGLNPNFVMDGGEGKKMYFQSRSFPFAIKGLDVGDVDGDGQNELVIIASRQLIVMKKTQTGLVQAAKVSTPAFEFFLTVDVGDMNGDGVAEIYASKERGAEGLTESSVYEMHNGQLKAVVDNCSWYFRITAIPGEGPTLLGQQKRGEDAFLTTKVHRLKLEGNKIVSGDVVPLPRHTNVYNFAFARFKGGVDRIVRINQSEYLQVVNRKGENLWESDDFFGGAANFMIRKEENLYTSKMKNRYYIPARIIVADLDGNGESDIIVNRNSSTTSRITGRYKMFSSGEIVCLNWRGLGLTEKWTTRKIPGYVSDYSLKDLDNDGKLDLITSVVRMNPAGYKEGTSTIISFALAPVKRTAGK